MPSARPARRPLATLALLVSLLCGLARLGCGSEPTHDLALSSVEPHHVPTTSPTVLHVHGQGLETPALAVVLRQGDRSTWLRTEPLSDRLLLAVAPVGLAPGNHELELQAPGELPRTLTDGLEVVVPEESGDIFGPEVRLLYPDPGLGLRAGTWVWLQLEADDPAGVAHMGYRLVGLIEGEVERPVAAGGTTATARFPLWVPDTLEPFQLFYIVGVARDGRGNVGLSTRAYSMIICGPASASTPEVACQN